MGKLNFLYAQNGFSPLAYLLPLALVFVIAVVLLQTKVGQNLQIVPSPTPNLTQTQVPQIDLEECDDPYNADCYIEDDEADEVKMEDLLGPD